MALFGGTAAVVSPAPTSGHLPAKGLGAFMSPTRPDPHPLPILQAPQPWTADPGAWGPTHGRTVGDSGFQVSPAHAPFSARPRIHSVFWGRACAKTGRKSVRLLVEFWPRPVLSFLGPGGPSALHLVRTPKVLVSSSEGRFSQVLSPAGPGGGCLGGAWDTPESPEASGTPGKQAAQADVSAAARGPGHVASASVPVLVARSGLLTFTGWTFPRFTLASVFVKRKLIKNIFF